MFSFKQIISLDKTPSTNSYAKDIMAEFPDDNYIVKTYNQIAGRGLGTNKWFSDKDKNISSSFSIKLKELKAENQFLISQVISLTILKFLSQFISPDKLYIKWPNDIYVEDKKICGILIESFLKGDKIDRTICGVGININQESFPEWIPNPTSIFLATNIKKDLDLLFIKLLDIFESQIKSITLNSIEIEKEYLRRLYRIDQFASFERTKNNSKFEGKIKGINKFGQLIIEHLEGELEEFGFKEIKFII